MPTQEKILMRKLKRLQKKKLKVITQQANNKQESHTEYSVESSSTEDTTENESLKRIVEDIENNYASLEKKKKKKLKIELKEESLTENDTEEEENNTENNEIKSKEVNQLPASNLCQSIPSLPEFSSLEGKVCEPTLRAIKEMGFTTMTEIQAKAIPPLLEGKHLVGIAKTGSGKTLAFLIPVINFIYRLKYKPRNGTGAIILCPTRELAMQTYGVLMDLMKYNHHTYGLVMGGANRKTEARKLANGINILVATPGRLLDHMRNTEDFIYKNMFCLAIDEVDRLLEMGFEEEVKQIIKSFHTYRLNMFFSVTKTKKMEELIAFTLKFEPLYVSVDDHSERATVANLEQGFFYCPPDKRIMVLYTFLKKCFKKKVMVFFSTCMSVQFHHDLFNYIDLPVMAIHGKQEQTKRTSTFFQFCDAEKAILLCTDIAARGLDIPAVDWIVQYDPPDDPTEYIHRVGRTARGLGTSGQALLFLRREEIAFLAYLQQAKITLNELQFSWDQGFEIQASLEKLISRNYSLNQLAKEAYTSYVRAYDSHRLKNIFDIKTLDLAMVAKSFGFSRPPVVDLKITTKGFKQKKKRRENYNLDEKKTIKMQ
ncbi:unnamed protein product [Euphydryas editha]|uniref:ATP-dependent RNA helicase n=1 Tax=Euphydryas editha TaxID=104508 RepID=A0AAU9TI92_EUPED|nr:unnamed protein product [Euphydryas editha]